MRVLELQVCVSTNAFIERCLKMIPLSNIYNFLFEINDEKNINYDQFLIYLTGYKVNPVDLAPQYASVLAGLVTSGVFGAIVSTAIAGALRQKVQGTTSCKNASICAFDFHEQVSTSF